MVDLRKFHLHLKVQPGGLNLYMKNCLKLHHSSHQFLPRRVAVIESWSVWLCKKLYTLTLIILFLTGRMLFEHGKWRRKSAQYVAYLYGDTIHKFSIDSIQKIQTACNCTLWEVKGSQRWVKVTRKTVFKNAEFYLDCKKCTEVKLRVTLAVESTAVQRVSNFCVWKHLISKPQTRELSRSKW